ncbi:MAG: protein kinase [Planctomycetes bacterium]|nr:protein kinase [Planctomycetota bacterium]
MGLDSGTRLGPYEILSPLGSGGMGEVYLATDSKLDRKVAIKVLPELLTRDKERVARFEREAKLLASLNHPNIAAIYGFETTDSSRGAGFSPREETEAENATAIPSSRKLKHAAQGGYDSGTVQELHFLVMEYVEGETLGSHLKNGPAAVEDALDIAKQMAEALEAAHGQGVIHRDLKPANIMIRPDGTVKVLDFGLAKAMTEDSSGAVDANSPTITANYTRPGVVLGTAAYMSPEQARGRPLDKRTDIWSFGIILFECLTGDRLFQGETANDSMGAIMHKEPDWSLLPPNTPPTIQLLLRRCLTKDRKRRLHDIADARIELENAIVDPTSTSLGLAQAVLDVRRRWLPSWPVNVVIAMVVTLAAIGGWFARPQPEDSSPVVRLTAIIPKEQELADSRMTIAAISPDGAMLVYLATTRTGTGRQLYLRHLHLQESVALANTADPDSPGIFSYDGRWIAFAQQGKLKKVSILGGPAQTICDAAQLRGAHWGVNDTIALAPTRRSGIWIVSASGGKPEQVTDLGPDPGAASHRWPHLLPDGRSILFTHTDNEDDYSSARIEAVSIDTGERKVLVQGAMDARYIPIGQLVFVRGDVLMAVEFDPVRVEIMGAEIPVLEGVAAGPAMGSGQYSFSDNGVLVYLAGEETAGLSELVWVDRAGKITPVSQHSRDAVYHSLSPDGSRIAWTLLGGLGFTSDIWILEIKRDMLTRLTFDDGQEGNPVWSPDGLWIYFNSDRVHGVSEIYRRKADGSGDAERLTTADNTQRLASISPDGRTLVIVEALHSGGEIMLLHMDKERTVEPFLTTPFAERNPAVSPDGTLIAYSSDETGIFEVYVRRFPSGTGRVKISPGLGVFPTWSPDGTELFYTNDGSEFYSVAIEVKDDVLIPGIPKLLFKLSDNEYSDHFDVAPDGQRFLFSRLPGNEGDERIHPTVVVNWFKELREKMATVKGR